MSYLERLKAANPEKQATKLLQKVQEAPFDSFCSSHTVHFPENEGLPVVCYTPAGNTMMVQAMNAEHAEWLQRMNPKPTTQVLVMDSLGIIDDRQHCADCANLSQAGRCLSAWRGEILAGSHDKPIDDLPRRCNGYVPKANDPDQRTARSAGLD